MVNENLMKMKTMNESAKVKETNFYFIMEQKSHELAKKMVI
jgi:hypothetical protein